MSDRVDNRPPNARIAAHYRDLITSGALKPGTLLPSIKTLAEKWGVSTATVEKALGKLRAEHLVRGIHGVGTEVVGQPLPLSSGSQRQDRGRSTGSSWGTGERSDSHAASLVAAPAPVAVALDVAPGERVLRRTRVYRDGHGIVAHSTSWIPGELAELIPELLNSGRLVGGTSLDLIAHATGRRAVQRHDETGARLATDEDRELLELRPGTKAAILVLTARFVDAQERPVEYGVDLGAPGRTRVDTSDVTL